MAVGGRRLPASRSGADVSGAAAGRRRFCQALDLIDSPALIAEYQQHHQRIWPGIAAHLREHGILDMEIYRLGTRLFMIVEVSADFDAARFDAASLNNPEVQRWEALMWHYQATTPWTPQGEKWVEMARIFSLQQQ
nr:L-rhamnose mutarotase [Serratia sp. 4542]